MSTRRDCRFMKPCKGYVIKEGDTPRARVVLRCHLHDRCVSFIPDNQDEPDIRVVLIITSCNKQIYGCRHYHRKVTRLNDYIRPEISKERCACPDKGHLNRAIIKVTSCYCPKEEQDIFHDDLDEHCRFCGQCQRGKPIHEITNRHDYLMQYGRGLKLNPKQII